MLKMNKKKMKKKKKLVPVEHAPVKNWYVYKLKQKPWDETILSPDRFSLFLLDHHLTTYQFMYQRIGHGDSHNVRNVCL